MSLQIWLPLTKDTRNQGIAKGDITWTTAATFTNNGKLGKALATGGCKMPASMTSQALNNTAVSIACWLYVNADADDSTNRAMIFGNDSMSTLGGRQFSIFRYPNADDIHLSWQNYNDGTYSGAVVGGVWSGVLTPHAWNHVCVTYQNPKATVYVNGVQVGTASGVINTDSFAYDTQVIYSSTSHYINDFRIYNHCLSQMEVKELAKGLVLHYPLNRQGWGQENLGVETNQGVNRWSNRCANGTYSLESVKWLGVDAVKMNCEVASTSWKMFTHNGFLTNWDKYVAGGTYTLSYDTSGEVPVTLIGLMDSNARNNVVQSQTLISNTISSNKQHYEYRIVLKNPLTKSSQVFYFANNLTANTSVRIANLKFEEGSIATPWCPNSSDTLATTMGLNGTTEYDCSGFCNNGTRTGTFSWTSDTPKYSVSTNFAAVGTVTNNTIPIHLSNEFTIAWWGKVNSWKKSWEGMFLLQNSAALNAGLNTYDITSAIHASTANSMSLTICQNGSSFAFDKYKWTYTIGTWTHYTCTYKAGAISIYQNGVLVYTETITDNSSNDYYYRLGGRASACDCQMSDFRIYATALSADDILELYQQNHL